MASTFSALQHREFRLLFAGQTVANLGLWIQDFALGWLVVQLAVREGTPALAGFYLGLRSMAAAASGVAFGVFAGVVADRVDRRTLLLQARAAAGVVALLLAAAVLTDHATLPVVLLLSAASGAAWAFDPPTRQAMLPSIVPVRDLFSSIGLMRATMQAAHTIGPLIGGLLMVPLGLGGVLLTNAGGTLASLVALLPMRAQPPAADARETGVLRSLREGFVYVRDNDVLRWCTLSQLVFAILIQSFNQLLPAIAQDTLHAEALELSWLVAAAGVGSLAGALVITVFGGVRRRGVLLVGSLVSVSALTIVLGMQRELGPMLVVLVALGVNHQAFMGTQTIALQVASADRYRGRVLGLQTIVFNSAAPVGVLVIGTLGSAIGISNAVFAGGALALVLALLMLRVPSLVGLRGDAAER